MDVNLTNVEKAAVQASAFAAFYPPTEKMPAIIVENFPSLGKLAAMRFIEWIQSNPGGVISLPTGKTPEHFIKWVERLLGGWKKRETKELLEDAGVDPSKKPDMKSLHFVQIDEFYPMDPSQHNSFNHYVREFYIGRFGLDPDKALLMDPSSIGLKPGQRLGDIWPDNYVDLTLRYRQVTSNFERRQKAVLEQVDQWCMQYEHRIAELGGIGFFLGGIGPDGHIGFNIKGSDHNSTTRLCPVNYETQAAAAADLGGIETARKCLVITIGLKTITLNRDCAAIIIAAGQAKARLIAQAIESDDHIRVPASCLRQLPNARFYITRGAAGCLLERRIEILRNCHDVSDATAEEALVHLAAKTNKRLTDLTRVDGESDRFVSAMLEKRAEPLGELARMVHENLISKIESGVGVYKNKCFLHTEPHHDDIVLGYFAQVVRHFRRHSNTHHFVTLTSGFTAVTNEFMAAQMASLLRFLGVDDFRALIKEGYFARSNETDRNRDVWEYLDGVAAKDEYHKAEGCARRMLRNLLELYDESFVDNMEDRISELENYFVTVYPGKKDPEYIQRLKGMCREWEAECLWGYYGWQCQNIRHLRLGFYTGDIFTSEPRMDEDVLPIARELERIDPDVVTVAFDPEASGPDTHYKVMQALAEALRIHVQRTGKVDLKIWGYRNVWFRFDPSEANVYVPVTMAMFATAHDAFMNSFTSQKSASFPSYEYDGPFSELAQRIQVRQYRKIKTCLGREWFHNHPSGLIRATRGLVFLKEMTPEEFFQSCRELRKSVENI
ncbi:MAG: glucosamine-6-phosphate deaminase [Phycisphaerae bacterium SG8_4]|nr:MAG: glucosamine-6-phosphate deaminase [Phycisphaerae bacterium SG8_4]